MAGIFTERIWHPACVNQTNLNGKLRKNLGGHGPPRSPLESPLLSPSTLNMKHYKSVENLSNFQNVKTMRKY